MSAALSDVIATSQTTWSQVIASSGVFGSFSSMVYGNAGVSGQLISHYKSPRQENTELKDRAAVLKREIASLRDIIES